MIETLLTSAGVLLYTWVANDLAKDYQDSWIQTSFGGLPTEILGSTTDRIYELAKRKIKERFPNLIRENKKTLLKAVRKSQMKAIRDACAAYRTEIKGTSSESYNRASIKEVESFTYKQEKLLSKNVPIDSKSLTALAIDERIINTQIPLLQRSLFNELPKADTLPVRFKQMIETGWVENKANLDLFQRISFHFEEELKKDSELTNLFHTHLIKNIAFTLNDIAEEQTNQTARIDEIRKRIEERADELEKLGYRILREGNECQGIALDERRLDEKFEENRYLLIESFNGLFRNLTDSVQQSFERTRETVTEYGEKILANLEDQTSRSPQVAYGLRNLKEKVYGRDDEKEILLKTLGGETSSARLKKFALIVAPSGFGKSFLVQKALQDVYDEENKVIKSEYKDQVKQILLIDCRLKKTLNDVVSEFNELLGTQESYDEKLDYLNFSRQLVQLPQNKIWLILDNFESWLDKDYKIINAEIRAFLNALFEMNHNLRGVFLSQSEPEPHFKNKLNELESVGLELLKGLPEDVAIDYLRTEGQEVGLDKVDESLLKEFLNRVARIPQALPSLIDYLKLKKKAWQAKGKSFADFINDEELWESFDDYEEHEDEDIHIRRTKALIKAQIEAQSDYIQLIICIIAFFDREVPYQALELLFENEDEADEAILQFSEHKIAFERVGIRGTIYYDLHSYFRDVALKILTPPKAKVMYKYSIDLFNKAYAESSKTYFNRAIALYNCVESIDTILINTAKRNRHELIRNLAMSCLNKGGVLGNLGRYQEAIVEYDKAISIRQFLVDEGHFELAIDLVMAYVNKGVSLRNLGEFNKAIVEYDKAISTFQSLFEKGDNELADRLAMAHVNKGISLVSLGQSYEAIIEFDKATAFFQTLVETGQNKLADKLAMVYINKGRALYSLGKLDEAIIEFDKTIAIFNALGDDGHIDPAGGLALAYTNKGTSLDSLGKLNKAIIEHNKALEILQPLVDAGRLELTNDLARVYMHKGLSLMGLGEINEAIIEFDKTIFLQQSLVDSGRLDLVDYLAMTYLNKGGALINLGRFKEAIIEFDKTISIRQPLVNTGRLDLADKLAKAYLNKGSSLISLGKCKEAIIEFDKTINILQPLVDAFRPDLVKDLAIAYLNKSTAFEHLNDSVKEAKYLSKAINLLEEQLQMGNSHLLLNYIKALQLNIKRLIKLASWQLVANEVTKLLMLTLIFESDDFSDEFKGFIEREVGMMLWQIKQLPADKQAKIYEEANLIGQQSEQPELIGDILRQYVDNLKVLYDKK